MEVSKNLLDLTNKFLEDFFEACAKEEEKQENPKLRMKRDDGFSFHFTLADAIAQSNYPRYEEEHTILMGMSSFDDSIAKAMFNNRIQGFVKIIEDRLAYTGEQDDYLVKNIKTKDYIKEDKKCRFYTTESGEHTFDLVPCKIKAQKVTFDVGNCRSGFNGNVVVYKELSKEFTSENDFTERMVVKKIDFYCNSQEVMSIDYRYNFENLTTPTYYEEGKFSHYKHIADINSFFFVISNY
jgi:hypothetical protein